MVKIGLREKMRDRLGAIGQLGTRLANEFRQSVVRNPFVWALFALFLLVEYENYTKGADIRHVCELIGPHDFATAHPRNDKEEIDNICISYQADDDDNE